MDFTNLIDSRRSCPLAGRLLDRPAREGPIGCTSEPRLCCDAHRDRSIDITFTIHHQNVGPDLPVFDTRKPLKVSRRWGAPGCSLYLREWLESASFACRG